MIKVGITGQPGFIGTHLFNTLGLYPDIFKRISFEDSFFRNDPALLEFVRQCDVIVHLAAMNRHNSPELLYQTNVNLVEQLIDACERTDSCPHIFFSSSTQEEKDNHYGKSKRKGRQIFEKWAEKNKAKFTAFIIPNVFGPFGNPYYNSVVATFCYQLTHNEIPKIEVDSEINLIYVEELVTEIINHIKLSQLNHKDTNKIVSFNVPHTSTIQVSELLILLQDLKSNYFEKGEIPSLDNSFVRNLFNTFICYIDHTSFFPYELNLNKDHRGSFVEIIKPGSGGQISFSTTSPGVTRGNHFHTRKAERFAVIKGKASINIRRVGTDKVMSFTINGAKPAFIDMPIWHTHNIKNIGNDELFTIFWINESFNPEDPDTFVEIV